MSHVSNREIASMSTEAREARLLELQEELLQLRAEKALGGTPSNMGAYKATRRSIARVEDAHEQRSVKQSEVMENNGGYLQRLRATR